MPTARRRRAPTAPEPEVAILLTGPPGRLTTTVSVENASADRLIIRRPMLRLDGAAVTAVASAIVPPGQTASVPVTISLDPSTAPGRHEAELEVGGVSRPVIVDITPHLALELSPRRTLAAPGSQEVTFVVKNTGNVRMPLSSLTMARTDDGGAEPGPDVVLRLPTSTVIEPGQTVTLSGRLEVPDDLEPARRHTAQVPVGIADLDVIILPRDASETKS